MANDQFKALVLTETDGAVQSEITQLSTGDLPDGDVLVSVAYSTLNYKDGLAVTGKGRVVRRYPMVPGIDFAGTVEESRSPLWKPGDRVILTGWEVGEKYWGGFAQKARARAEWLVPLPAGMSLEQAMGFGTAGFTAMLCVIALEEHGLKAGEHPVLVTGAGGGVGSVAVAVLARLGYHVAASTGRAELRDYLTGLGAKEIVDRQTIAKPSGRPLESEHWAGAVDTVGGDTLAAILPTMRAGSSVAACGLAGGFAVNTTVMPFILRGVNLLGINSVFVPQARRRAAWERLARDVPADLLSKITRTIPLADVPAMSVEILKGNVRGRIIIDVQS
ncbi:MAG: acrylyl-CoA reductase (NADPH) [Thermomicrobiales bacterium]